jgi:hypothetical protein
MIIERVCLGVVSNCTAIRTPSRMIKGGLDQHDISCAENLDSNQSLF